MPAYVVERYWPGVTPERLSEALERTRSVIREMRTEGTIVRSIRSTLIPTDEFVFSIYEAPSERAVRSLNERSRIPFDRITEAIEITEEKRGWFG